MNANSVFARTLVRFGRIFGGLNLY